MRHKKAAVCCLLLLMAAALFADDWVLAAEAFSGDEAAGTLMPSLILDALPGSLVHYVSEQEQIFRKMLLLEKDRSTHSSSLDKLIRERDAVIFTTEGTRAQQEKFDDYEKKIAEESAVIQQNLSDYSALESLSLLEEPESGFESLEENVVLWQNSTSSLYKRSETDEPADIKGLITGTAQVRNGFLYVRAGLTMYPGGIVCNEVVAAGSISDAAVLAEELATALVDTIVNATPVSLAFTVRPAAAVKGAEVTVDGMNIQNPENYHAFQSGIHTITIESPGYEKQTFTRDFSEASRYQIDALLPVQNSVNLSLAAYAAEGVPSENAQVWIAGRNAGFAPVTVTVNGRMVLGVIQGDNDVPTYFTAEPSSGGSTAGVLLRKESSQSRIEKSRKSLYTSYGLLLVSLPFTFYFYGRMADAYNGFTYGMQVRSTADEFYKWQKLERISLCVSIGCGANMVYRLVRYMIDANSVLPETAEPEEEEQ